jgi:Rad3-related DNA helicase
MTYLKTLDGTGRKPFPIQIEFLEWLQKQTSRVVAAQLPPGTGKSLIVRSIQRATGAAVITPSNILVNQYAGTYPDVNVLKGQAHYECPERGVSCAEVKALKMKPCKDCVYRGCRRAALEAEATFYNPMSLYYLTQDESFERPAVTVVDEAHKLFDMLLLVAGKTFTEDKYRLPTSDHLIDVITWLKEQKAKTGRLSEHHATKEQHAKAARLVTEQASIERVMTFLEREPENYSIAFGTDKRRNGTTVAALIITPLLPPRELVERVLGTGRVILLSGTLSRMDAAFLSLGDEAAYIDMASPIPAVQRQVLYRPKTYERTEELYQHMLALHEEFGGPTLVHVTYGLAAKILALHPKAMTCTKETKEKVVASFKEHGGLFFASGCAEGLDLPDGQCRLNIIPILPRPNVGDSAVKKWLAQPGGSQRYDLETLRTFQQQVGRSTRHVKDWSVTVCCDPRLPRLTDKNRADISKSFMDSINWTGKKRGIM